MDAGFPQRDKARLIRIKITMNTQITRWSPFKAMERAQSCLASKWNWDRFHVTTNAGNNASPWPDSVAGLRRTALRKEMAFVDRLQLRVLGL